MADILTKMQYLLGQKVVENSYNGRFSMFKNQNILKAHCGYAVSTLMIKLPS